MTELETICEKALYQELQTFADGRSLVMDLSSNQIYYRKTLSVYSIPVFSWLKEHSHPHIPVISAFWQQDDKLIVIEEQISGKTLEQLLEEGDLPFAEKKRILLAVCDGLSFLHDAEPPIIHRDLKASNIMVADDGAVKLIDYDAAKIYDKDAKRDTVLIGTQGIAAPEQYGFGASDARTDIFALGKLIERLFHDDAAAAVIVDKATRMEPADRYANVAQVRAKIAKLKESGAAGGAGGSGVGKAKKGIIVAAVALAAVIALVLWLSRCDGSVPGGESANSMEQETGTSEQENKATEPQSAQEQSTGAERSEEATETSQESEKTSEFESTADQASQPESTAAPTESTEPHTQQPTTTQAMDLPWQAAITLEEGEPMGDMKVMKLSASLSGGPQGGSTHVRFEIDVKATGEQLSYTTEEVYAAGQTAMAMFTAQGQESSGTSGSYEYQICAYSDGGELMGEFGGTVE